MLILSDDDAAVEGRCFSYLADDGWECLGVALRLNPDLNDEQRALAIHEGLMAAKARLCANTLH